MVKKRVIMGQEELNEFIPELIKYYELSMNDIARSIEELAKMQERYPKGYEEFQKIAEKPELLLEIKIDDKIKAIFFELLLKSSTLTQKINKLIILTPTEKKALAEDLKSYVGELKKKYKELNSQKEK